MTWRGALLLLLPVPAIVWTQTRIDGVLGEFRAQEEALYLWSGRRVKQMFPGLEDLAADVYWLRTVQYFGGKQAFVREVRFDLLYPLIDITTTLDPRLEIAYRYGAIFLSEGLPLGAGRPRDGIAILERGTQVLPQSWRLRQDLGFFHYLYLKDPHRASQILVQASEIPGAAFWLKNLAADILAKGGDRRSSRQMWQQMADQGEEGVIKANAALHLRILDALDRADQLQALSAEFERRVGRRPHALEELQAAGLLRESPVDSTGVPFEYDAESGRVKVSPRSSLWRPN